MVFLFLHSKMLLGFTCSFALGSPHSSLSLFLRPVLWPLWIPCSCLTIYLFPFSDIWEPSLKGKGVMTTQALYRGIVRLWVPFACSLPGCIYDLQREMGIHGMIRRLVSALSGCWPGNILIILSLRDLLYSRRNKLNKKVKSTWPRDEQKWKSF